MLKHLPSTEQLVKSKLDCILSGIHLDFLVSSEKVDFVETKLILLYIP